MSDRPAFDPTVQTENIAFDQNEMVECAGCGRANPPNRFKCIYCAKELAVAERVTGEIKPVLRKLELWEPGFNLIVLRTSGSPGIHAAADFLSIEPGDVAAVVDAPSALPLIRVESETEASVVRDRMSNFGIECSIVSDKDLAPEKPPTRLSRIEFLDSVLAVTAFNTGERKEIPADRFVLLIPGTITSGRVDSLEKKRRGGKTKLLDEMATASDEMLLDVYTQDDPTGFRIHLAGFDFSCLGDEMGLLAGENLRLLIVRLAEHLPNCKLVNDYSAIRHTLDRVWEIESRKDSRGLQRAGFGKVEFGSTASSSNLNQFTKYSRLQWHLL